MPSVPTARLLRQEPRLTEGRPWCDDPYGTGHCSRKMASGKRGAGFLLGAQRPKKSGNFAEGAEREGSYARDETRQGAGVMCADGENGTPQVKGATRISEDELRSRSIGFYGIRSRRR